MKQALLLTFAVFAVLFAHAQDTVYVYTNLSEIPHIRYKQNASYYYLRTNPSGPLGGTLNFYDLKGNLYAEVNYNSAGKRDGLATFYYKEGGKEKELTYQNGEISGPYKTWYRNGQINEEGKALPPAKAYASSEYLLYQYWDSLGTQLLKGGNGELSRYYKNNTLQDKGTYKGGRKVGRWIGNSEDGSLYYEEEYQEGRLLQGSSFKEGKEYAYTELEEEALPQDGMQAFYQFLFKNVEYPRAAFKAGKQGTAYIRFVVNEAGIVESAETIEGYELGHGLDEEAMRVILLTKWEPGKQRGIIVKQRKILPVKFKLAR